jgi:hypothetical protein
MMDGIILIFDGKEGVECSIIIRVILGLRSLEQYL